MWERLISISIATPMLGPRTSILSIHLSPTCGHPIMQLESGYHEILREPKPKVYRYRTWQDTAVRHTLSSFKFVRLELRTSRTACLSRKHSHDFHLWIIEIIVKISGQLLGNYNYFRLYLYISTIYFNYILNSRAM